MRWVGRMTKLQKMMKMWTKTLLQEVKGRITMKMKVPKMKMMMMYYAKRVMLIMMVPPRHASTGQGRAGHPSRASG
jgi:hypothetical protein